MAIAQEVVVSAGNILAAAGFSRHEIAHFLRQAADQLAPQEGAAAAVDAPPSGLHAQFAALEPVAALAKLAGEARLLGTAGPLADRFDSAMRMLPPLAEAQDWLRNAAADAGVALLAADGGDGETGDGALHLAAFEVHYAAATERLGDLVQELAQAGDERALTFLLAALVENGISVSAGLKAAMEQAVATLMPR